MSTPDIIKMLERYEAAMSLGQYSLAAIYAGYVIDGAKRLKAKAEDMRVHKPKENEPLDMYYMYEPVIDEVAEKMLSGEEWE